MYSSSNMPESNLGTVSFSTLALASIPKHTIVNMYVWKTSLEMYLNIKGLHEFIETMPIFPDDHNDQACFDM